jgi:hypothetical protein
VHRERLRSVLSQEALIGGIGIVTHIGENVRPVASSHRGLDLIGWAVERCLAAGRQEQDIVTEIEVGQRVCDHHHHAAGVGELAQHHHDLTVQRGV